MNTGARLTDVYQNGMLVHHKIRHGATQTVIVKQVQHVQVNDGGPAVVAGTMKRSGAKKANCGVQRRELYLPEIASERIESLLARDPLRQLRLLAR
jgi:hypothetical protein